MPRRLIVGGDADRLLSFSVFFTVFLLTISSEQSSLGISEVGVFIIGGSCAGQAGTL
jgi:hypothetical protein